MPISGQRARPPVRNLFYLSFGGLLHHLLTERIALPAENLPHLFALIPVRIRRYNAVFGVGAEHIKITVLKAILSFVEHIECFRLVLFHGDNCSLKQSFGFFGSAILACPQVGRNGTACLELAAGLSEPGLRPELAEAGERALEVLHRLAGSADCAEPTAVGKKRSSVLERADHVASVRQRIAKELVDLELRGDHILLHERLFGKSG